MQPKKSNNYAFLKKAISKVSKAMYRTSLDFPSFSPLNPSSITNQTFDNTDKSQKISEKDPSPKRETSNHHHKLSEGIQIYLLPKLPFGSHKTYNEEADFVGNHFQFNAETPDLTNKVETLQRKFQLLAKKDRKTGKFQRNRRVKTESPGVYTFKTKTGYLFCPFEEEMIKMYDKCKQDFENDKKIIMGKDQNALTVSVKNPKKSLGYLNRRLYPERITTETPSSLFYSTKYSPLFSKDKISRPKTSLEN
jgi:DNA replication protein DnaD